jgi:DNA phosphorothioation-dependent restriction protein DptH
MKYIAHSFKDYISGRIESQLPSMEPGRKMIFMVDSIPENLTIATADLISSSLLEKNNVNVLIKIAKTLTDQWSEEGITKAKEAQWLTLLDNLAYYRNEPMPADKFNVIILYGADVVTDSASLADFILCNLKMVWETGMMRSFSQWISDKLSSSGIELYNKADLQIFDNILYPIIEQGRADLISLSNWLERLDLSYCDSVPMVLNLVLTKLRDFQLPNFTSFPYTRKNKKFNPYVYKAIEFFNYTMFIEENQKKRAVKAIDGILETIEAGEEGWEDLDNEQVRGAYSSGIEFLSGINNYVLTEDWDDKNKLLESDFVFILDKILKFKKKQEKKKTSVKSLEGSPVEIVLTALWDSLSELSKSKDYGSVETLSKIEITGDLFKHNMEWDDSDGDYSTQDVSELAREFLHRLIGGLDCFIMQHTCLKNKDGADIEVKCMLDSDEIKFRYSRTAIAELAFSVNLYVQDEDKPQERKYAWKLPSSHSYRLATELIIMAADELNLPHHALVLPFFHLHYYDEILKTSSNDELRRIFLHSLRDSASEGSFLRNLLAGNWLKHEDKLLPYYKNLAEKYHLFIKAAKKDGLITALTDTSIWDVLRQQYEEVLDMISTQDKMLKSPMAGMILRAFMVVREREREGSDAWYGEAYEKSGIITVLHPSLLEMLQSQLVYQSSCFNYAVKAETEKEKRRDAFNKHIWQSYLDLSHIRTPINCILIDDGLNLNTNVVGHELIHKVGDPVDGEDLKSTKLMLGMSDDSDDEIGDVSDADMFLETRESKLLNNLLLDYFRLHPHARDGLNIAVYRNQDIQPIIAAIHAYLMKLSNIKDPNYYVIRNERSRPYNISVSIFTDSADDSGIARWIELWRERWEAAETESKFQVYRNCRFSISHRLINTADHGSFLRMINDNFSTDVTILYDIIGTGNIADKFESVDPMDIRTHSLKYPILEKAVATIDNPSDEFKRFRIISNRQFSISSRLAGCMHALKSGTPQKGTVVMGTGDLRPWMDVIGAIHNKSEWVICIDPSVDDRLIRDSGKKSELQREIIGFGSGVGISGEENYTISNEHFSLNDIEIRLRASIKQLIADRKWTEEDYQNVAKGTMKVAQELSGLSLVRATGAADQYIRDFMAYALTRKIIGKDETMLCDNLVTLDAYRHWFDFAESGVRPDLLWLKASLGQDNRLQLNLHLIECKMGNRSEDLLIKAKHQINNGLSVLVKAFKPNFQDKQKLDDDKPDRRYWWMQLHRLIAAKAKIDKYHEQQVISALEKLAEGDYEISWNASVMAFWIDDELGTVKRTGTWNNPETSTGKANVFSIGRNYIKALAQFTDESSSIIAEFLDEPLPDEENIMRQIEDIDLPPSPEDEDFQPGDALADWDDYEPEDDEGDTTPNWDDDTTPEPQQEVTPEDQPDIDQEPEGDEEPLDKDDNELPRIPERILLGKTTGGKEVYWEFGHDSLANRHVVILGTSGMGKTFAIQCILCELARAEQRSLILDYTDGFIPSKIEENAKSQIPDTAQNFIRKKPLPINPFKASVTYEAGLAFPDTPDIIAKRVASIFKSVYALGEQQFSLLVHAITAGVSMHGDDYSLDKLLHELPNYINNSHYTKTTIQTTITKISPFISSNPFTNEKNRMSWDQIFNDGLDRVTVFQFFQMDKDSARALIEFVLWDLYHYVSKEGSKNKPKVVILDEIQNLDLGQSAPVAKYLTEGRKHGLALISATQTLRGVGGVTDPKVSRLTQSDLKLFFKPSINEIREHAQLLHVSFNYRSVSDWSNELSKLKKGECWAVGMFVNDQTGILEPRAMKVKIASLEDRGFNG